MEKDCIGCKIVSSLGIGGSALYAGVRAFRVGTPKSRLYWGLFSSGTNA